MDKIYLLKYYSMGRITMTKYQLFSKEKEKFYS